MIDWRAGTMIEMPTGTGNRIGLLIIIGLVLVMAIVNLLGGWETPVVAGALPRVAL